MKKYQIETLLFGLIMILVFISGIVVGRFHFPITREVAVTERLKSCEEKGGKYTFRWSIYSEKYIEECDISSKSITDF